MTSTEPGSAAAPWQGDRLRGAPRRLLVLLLAVEALVLGWVVVALLRFDAAATVWRDMGLLLVLSLAFEEMSRRVGKMRLLISAGPSPDMTSVWTFAAAVLLPPGHSALVVVAVTTHLWVRQHREIGLVLYRKVYTAATIAAACLTTSTILHPAGSHLHLGGSVVGALAVVAALVAYTLVQRLLISAAVLLTGAPRSASMLLGRWDENALEISTLCLGFLTALVLADAPWLGILVLLPMVLLQRGSLFKQLEQTASTDTKTQLLTATAWRDLAERALGQITRRSSTAALLIIDLDHFKAVNDLHGHLIGDAALLAASARLSQEVRQGDIVGRFGGEEFVVLLLDADEEVGLRIAERLRQHISLIRLADLQASHSDGSRCEHALSASVGIAVSPPRTSDLSALFSAADSALFVAKRAGRNRVELADPGWQQSSPAAAG